MGQSDRIWALASPLVESLGRRTLAQSDISKHGAGGFQYSAADCHTNQSCGNRIAGTGFNFPRYSAGTIGKITGYRVDRQSVCFN